MRNAVVLVLLGHVYKKAREWKLYTGENPTTAVKKPKLDNKVTEFLSADEMERLLGDSTVTPKTVGQVIDQLNDQTEALRHTMEALPEDHPLQELGNEVTVLATVDSIKWDRGDYL